MSHLSKIFEEAPIKVQNRNGFDLSHVHAGTSKTGQLVPVLTKLLAPNSTISLGVNAEVNLPPLVSPFYGKIDFAVEGFIVPCSILYGGWKQFISNQEWSQFPANQTAFDDTRDFTTVTRAGSNNLSSKSGYALPYFNLCRVAANNMASFNSLNASNDNLYSYMGMNIDATSLSSSDEFKVSLMPALAYHKICDTFYRNTKLTKTWFAVNPNVGFYETDINGGIGASTWGNKNVSLIWHSFYTPRDIRDGEVTGETLFGAIQSTSADFNTDAQLTFPDGTSIFSTRQRTYMRDYFTSAVYNPQQGGASVLKFSVDSTDSTGEFTINSLRMANSLQKFLETNNLSGDFGDMIRNRWGVRPIDADFDEPHYLGRVVIPVYQHTVYQSNNNIETTGEQAYYTTNPYAEKGLLGSSAGVGKANGEGSICDHFNVSTWSYLMCLASLYPHANYNYGINRELTMTSLGDFPAPELQSVGMEEIKNYEIGARNLSSVTAMNGTFGYIPRYSRFKYIDDFVSGELAPGKTLESYQLQRSFSSTPQLGTSFVTIAQNALDGVLAVNTSEMNLSCWWEIYFNLKVVMPLADFCIPTLGELADTHTIKATVGGSRL